MHNVLHKRYDIVHCIIHTQNMATAAGAGEEVARSADSQSTVRRRRTMGVAGPKTSSMVSWGGYVEKRMAKQTRSRRRRATRTALWTCSVSWPQPASAPANRIKMLWLRYCRIQGINFALRGPSGRCRAILEEMSSAMTSKTVVSGLHLMSLRA